MAPGATASATSEIELVLQVTPEALARLRALEWFAPLLAAHVEGIRTRYYDTGDLAFRRRGFGFRVREAGGRIVQTIKTANGGSSVVKRRMEFDTLLTVPSPAPSLIPDPETRAAVLAQLDVKPLCLVFETAIERRRAHVHLACGSHVELSLDEGVVRAGVRSRPVCEIELELLAGEPEALMTLALALARAAPVRLGLASKAARGYALLAPARPGPVKAARPACETDDLVEDVFTRIVDAGLSQITGNEAALVEERDPRAVHQMRVGLRRLRAGAGLFRRPLGARHLERGLADAKALGLILGPVRDYDVLLQDILGPVQTAHGQDADLEALRTRADEARGAAWDVMLETWGRSSDLADLVLSWELVVQRRPWREDEPALWANAAPPVIGAMLKRRWRKALRLGRKLDALSIPERHELRIALKKLRYGCAFFQDLFEKERVKPWLRQLSMLQDSFGALNDVATADVLLPALLEPEGEDPALEAAAKRVRDWHQAAARDDWQVTCDLWAQLEGMAPFWTGAKPV